MTFRRIITIAALVLLGILLAGFAALGFSDIYRNQIVKECGADCRNPAPEGTVQSGS